MISETGKRIPKRNINASVPHAEKLRQKLIHGMMVQIPHPPPTCRPESVHIPASNAVKQRQTLFPKKPDTSTVTGRNTMKLNINVTAPAVTLTMPPIIGMKVK